MFSPLLECVLAASRLSGVGAASERAFATICAGVLVVDGRGKARAVNAEARFMLGLGGGDRPAPPSRVLEAFREVPELGALLVSGEGVADVSLGEGFEHRRIRAYAFPVGGRRSRKRGVFLFLIDLTGDIALLNELAALASRDALTGVCNRRRFDELGERDVELARRSGMSVGVVMLDLDYFKRVNDERGHAVGDEMLKAFCSACAGALRCTDVLARYGGEEFAVLLPDSGREESMAVAERLRARVAGIALPCQGGTVSVTVSIGVYSGVPSRDDDLALYLRRADEALYRSKALGRNRASFWKPIE
jgi:diguanylate cyclase (GGDEF)-like protein